MKTLQIFEETVITKYKQELIEVDSDLVLILYRENSKVMSYSLLEKKRCKINKKKKTFDIKAPKKSKKSKKSKKQAKDVLYDTLSPNWEYFSPKIFDEIKKKYSTDIKWEKFKVDPYKEIKKNGTLDKSRILYFDWSSHLVHRFGQEAPLSSIQIFDYIEGVSDKDFHLEKAYKHLKKKKEVLEVREEEIPYYNRDRFCTKGLYMQVLLPQGMVDKIWDRVKKDDYPSVRLREAFVPMYWRKDSIDPLGIKKFQRSEKEMKAREEMRLDEDE